MAFSENIKKEVKEKAGFQCCICHKFGSIEVHHILPQALGGSDILENAAPLCPSCHTDFGDNPQKRKEITQVRDWWYGVIEKKYNSGPIDLKMLKTIDQKLETIQTSAGAVEELKDLLRDVADKTIDQVTSGTAAVTASGIVNTYETLSTKLGDRVHANVKCNKCGTSVGLLVGTNNCPECGQPL